MRSQRIYIVPTLFGLVSSVALFLMLLMAYTYQSNLAYAMTFFLTAFGFSAMTATHRFLRDVDLETYHIRPVFEGELFKVPVLPLEIEGPSQALDFFPRDKNFEKKPGGWIPLKRGAHELSQIEVKTSFPTGFFRAWKRTQVALRIIVAPRPRDFGLRPWANDGEAEVKSSEGADPGDLKGLAPARLEDPSSKIEWQSFARGRGLFRKDFEAPARAVRLLRWEDTEKLATVEDRLGQMSAWIQMLSNGEQFFFFGPAGDKTTKVDEALESLARFEGIS